jgi:hypothetical protein
MSFPGAPGYFGHNNVFQASPQAERIVGSRRMKSQVIELDGKSRNEITVVQKTFLQKPHAPGVLAGDSGLACSHQTAYQVNDPGVGKI